MTLQWTAVASFLYVEIAVLLILCLPFISAKRWQTVFKLNIWNKLANFWNKGFLTMIIILIVLFLDAVREVRKYSGQETSKDSKLNPNMFDHLHMKLFRAQRNLYISGFSLFLWLVMRRVITLISQLATSVNTSAALQTQADSANQAANKYMQENLLLKTALEDGGGGDGAAGANTELKNEVKKLSHELKAAHEALRKSRCEMEAMQKQAEGLTVEYDRLLQENRSLQDQQSCAEGKKDL